MNYAIIDLGSNSIRLVIYQVDENKNFKAIASSRDFVGIINNIEKGSLTMTGINRLVKTLNEFITIADLRNKCDKIMVFATASLRNLVNSTEVINKVNQETGLTIEIISDAQEAYYDYLGLKQSVDIKTGTLLDLGGGSGQIVRFKNDQIELAISLPIGCLYTFNNFVKNVFPTKKEIKNIEKYVKKQLDQYPLLKDDSNSTLLGIGGTIRNGLKFSNSLFNLNTKEISDKNIENIIKTLESDGALAAVNLINKIAPERLTTIIPGLVVVKAVMDYLNKDKVQIVSSGVREGYLWAKLNPEQITLIEN